MTNYPYKIDTHDNRIIGKNLIFLDEIVSTNDTAKTLVKDNVPDGTVVFARSQSGGRGRFDRKWHSQQGLGIYLSVIMRPEVKLKAEYIVSGISLGLAEACKRAFVKSAQIDDIFIVIKPPNDILIHGKKVCGILAESCIEDEDVIYMIAGIGINVYHGEEDFPIEFQYPATSLRMEAGSEITDEAVASAVLHEIDLFYAHLLGGKL